MTSRQDTLAVPGWMLFTMAAFVATVFHIFIDLHLGLFGEISDEMSVVKGLWGVSQSVLLAWWMSMTVMAAQGHGPAMKSSLFLTGLLAFVLNGLVALLAAPPISDAAPWQDLAHVTAIVAGYLALRSGIRELRARGWPKGGRLLLISIALVLVNAGLGAPLNLDALTG